MDEEREKIVAMLAEGAISAEEANELLEAIGAERSDAPLWPELPARGQAWRRPFNIALLGSLISGTLLWRTRQATGFWGFVHRFLLWPLALLCALAAAIAYLTKDAPWLHVRVKSGGNPAFTISMPFPASALQKALQVARSQAPDADAQEKIDAAAEFLAGMDAATLKDPLFIDINDEGDSVQVYLN